VYRSGRISGTALSTFRCGEIGRLVLAHGKQDERANGRSVLKPEMVRLMAAMRSAISTYRGPAPVKRSGDKSAPVDQE